MKQNFIRVIPVEPWIVFEGPIMIRHLPPTTLAIERDCIRSHPFRRSGLKADPEKAQLHFESN